MVYFCHEHLEIRRGPPRKRRHLRFTLWTLALAAVAYLVFIVHQKLGQLNERRNRDARAKTRRQSLAEADRRAIGSLVQNLESNSSGGETVRHESQDIGRRRLSRQADHGIDPDLPPRRG